MDDDEALIKATELDKRRKEILAGYEVAQKYTQMGVWGRNTYKKRLLTLNLSVDEYNEQVDQLTDEEAIKAVMFELPAKRLDRLE